MGSCLGMQEDVQADDVDCHKSYEQFLCAGLGLTFSPGIIATAGVALADGERRDLGIFCNYPRTFLAGGFAVAALSLRCVSESPDHSCLCGRCCKIVRVITCVKNKAPSSIIMGDKKKD